MSINRPLSWVLIALAALAACVTTPVSQRQALILVPFSQEVSLGRQAYGEVLKKEKVSQDAHLTEVVQRVARRIARISAMPNLEWEAELLDSKQQNAFALPGGKIAVYTGILPVCRNEAGLAAVMGHEIAHVIARHGAQRMSQQLIVTGAMTAASISLATHRDRNVIMGALGLGVIYGITLPFSRSDESEADEIGLIYMARAGYDPNEAARFWSRFATEKKGESPPEFMSTHPADETRVRQIQNRLPAALKEYQLAAEKLGLGETFDIKPEPERDGQHGAGANAAPSGPR